MDVSNNLDWRAELDQGRLAQEDFASGCANGGDFRVFERWTLGDFTRVASFEQPADHVVNVEGASESSCGRRGSHVFG